MTGEITKGIYLSPEMEKRIKEMAVKEKRSFARQVQKMLEDFFKIEDEKEKKEE